jgi:hypothetical protein
LLGEERADRLADRHSAYAMILGASRSLDVDAGLMTPSCDVALFGGVADEQPCRFV